MLVKSHIPQQQILACNETLLFITHCGINGITEAVANGVPLVGLPMFSDQIDNLANIVEKGIGIEIKKDMTAEELYQSIVEVRDNPRLPKT